MKKTPGLFLLCGIASLLVACNGGASTPAPAPAGPPPVVQTEPAPLFLSTALGNVRITGADSDPGFPPGCPEATCYISATPGELVVIWLEAEGGGPVAGDLTEDCEENASLIGEDNQSNSCFVAGVLDGRSYVIFPVVAPASRYALRWGDNSPVVIVP